jgi:glycosyltransferase involved in cell wall biosynthesis
MKIFIVIPVFNEEDHILQVVSDVQRKGLPIVVVNDGSSDRTKFRLDKHKSKLVTVINHKINLGKGAALKTGCDYAFSNGADAVVLMDSDGQHDPDNIDNFLNKINKGYEVIFGSRNLEMGVPLDRYIGNKVNSVLINILFGIYVSDVLCGFRAITKSAFEKIRWTSLGYAVETEMVLRTKKMNLKYCEVPVSTIYYDRFKGVSILDAFGVLLNIIGWKFKL